MNLYRALEHAERSIQEGKYNAVSYFIGYAEEILNKYDPNDSLGPTVPAICCFFTDENGIIHCGEDKNQPLFPGTYENRLQLCLECRKSSRKNIKALKHVLKTLKNTAGGQK